jgi:hypothetical protein
MLAPYAQQMNELKGKSGDLKGQSLRTSFHMAYGGPKCGAASKASAGGSAGGSGDLAQQTTDAVAGSVANTAAAKVAGGGLLGGAAASAISATGAKVLSGMFSKKKKPDTGDVGAASPAQAAAPNMVTMVTFTTETTAINTEPVAADRFEIPAGWKKIMPKAQGKEEPFTCPGGKDQ